MPSRAGQHLTRVVQRNHIYMSIERHDLRESMFHFSYTKRVFHSDNVPVGIYKLVASSVGRLMLFRGYRNKSSRGLRVVLSVPCKLLPSKSVNTQ